jgi:uncharacterized protein
LIFAAARVYRDSVTPSPPRPVVHLELHTGNLARACGFYLGALGWRTERVAAGPGAYQAFDWGGQLEGGVVECGTSRPLWVPYVEVPEITSATERAVEAGATVMFGPREGPAGWRSAVSVPDGGEVALWQPKR